MEPNAQIAMLKAQVDALTIELEYLKANFVPEPRFFSTPDDEFGGLAQGNYSTAAFTRRVMPSHPSTGTAQRRRSPA
jgi:hypothetical protein